MKEQSSEGSAGSVNVAMGESATWSHTSQLLLQAAEGSDAFANGTPNFLLQITNSALLDVVEADLWTCWRRCTRFSTWTSIYLAAKPTTPENRCSQPETTELWSVIQKQEAGTSRYLGQKSRK